MRIEEIKLKSKGIEWILRNPTIEDASSLSELRTKIDGQTEFMDREEGEGFISSEGFKEIILEDLDDDRSLFIVAEVDGEIVGFARCIGKKLRRFRHQAEFGICIERDYWGYGIGRGLLETITKWSDDVKLRKISLEVVEDNLKAIQLYEKYGFGIEGRLIDDRLHEDGKYHNTIIMGRFHS